MTLGILVFVCLTNLALGVFVLLRDRRAGYSRVFCALGVLVSAWILSAYITEASSLPLWVNDLANRIAYVSGFSVVLAALAFTYLFPVRRRIRRSELIAVGIISAIVLTMSTTQLVSGEVHSDAIGHLSFTVGPLIWVYVVGFLMAVILTARNLLKLPRNVEVSRKLQAKMILFAFVASAIVGLVLNVLIPLVSNAWHTAQYGGAFSTIILVGTIVYAIARHGLFDVRAAIVRTTAYVLSLATLAALYYVIALGVSGIFLEDQSLVHPLGVGLATLLAFLFQPIKHFFDEVTSQLFYKDNYNTGDFFSQLNHALGSTTDLRHLLQRAARIIASTLKAEQVAFVVRSADSKRHLTMGTVGHVKIPAGDIHVLEAHFAHNKEILVRTELLLTSNLGRLLASHRLQIVQPLFQDDTIVGLLCLGEHRTSHFNSRDLKVLRAIPDELIIAIQNALSIQEVKDLNANLEQRISSATKELRASNAQLQRLDESKDEFISMASHQLRTPLTSIKGYVSMLIEGDVGKVTDEQKQLLNEVFVSSERMVRLIGDFLNVSRLQTGRFFIEKRPVDLALLVQREIDSLAQNATTRGVKFAYKKPRKFPLIEIDENKIQQVIMNFADNAIYYSKDGSEITVTLKQLTDFIEFKVIDTGIGVPEDEQTHLFNKFFRATNARRARPDGTGVGLFLAKKVVGDHGGEIIFESKEGEGSTFGFRLPLPKTQATN